MPTSVLSAKDQTVNTWIVRSPPDTGSADHRNLLTDNVLAVLRMEHESSTRAGIRGVVSNFSERAKTRLSVPYLRLAPLVDEHEQRTLWQEG